MRPADITRLILLAAIWGSSFIFMRVLAPVLGAITTADSRLLIAGVAMLGYFAVIRFDLAWRENWKQYAIIGVVNSSIPFSLYAFAAQHIPASYSVIFNSTSPLFGAVFSAIWLNDKLTLRKIAGLISGAVGVALVSKVGGAQVDAMFGWSLAACLAAPMCYGLAGIYTKKKASKIKPMAISGGSQIMAGLALLPLALLFPPTGEINSRIVIYTIILAVLCGSIAYVLYYRLVSDVGPTKALSVTFLMPAFGMLWGVIFLHESVTLPMIAGCLMIIAGTVLIARK